MASWAHSAHKHLVCWTCNSAKDLLEGLLACDEGALGMGIVSEGVLTREH
jgi:hypothetical protein